MLKKCVSLILEWCSAQILFCFSSFPLTRMFFKCYSCSWIYIYLTAFTYSLILHRTPSTVHLFSGLMVGPSVASNPHKTHTHCNKQSHTVYFGTWKHQNASPNWVPHWWPSRTLRGLPRTDPSPISSGVAPLWSTQIIVSYAYFLSFSDAKTTTKWKKLTTWW